MGKEVRFFSFLLGLFWVGSALAGSARDPDQIYFPKGYPKTSAALARSSKKWPLVVLLHGFKVTSKFQKRYFGITQHQINKKGFVLFIPGTSHDQKGNRFWNAMDYCCDHFQSKVDDLGYIRAAVTRVIAENAIDPARVSLLGHSNGGFMLHRLICESADLFSSAASLAGASFRDLNQCRPSSPVSLMLLHGKKDWRVPYEGMNETTFAWHQSKKTGMYPYVDDPTIVRYPGAEELARAWAQKNGCDPTPEDLSGGKSNRAGSVLFKKGCKGGSEVKLLARKNWGHVPLIGAALREEILDFLLFRVK